MGSLYDIASDAVVRPREIGHTHLERRLYEKPLKATALLLGFLVYVFLVTLIQGEFLVRVARRLQGDLQTNIRVGGLRENTHSLTMSPPPTSKTCAGSFKAFSEAWIASSRTNGDSSGDEPLPLPLRGLETLPDRQTITRCSFLTYAVSSPDVAPSPPAPLSPPKTKRVHL